MCKFNQNNIGWHIKFKISINTHAVFKKSNGFVLIKKICSMTWIQKLGVFKCHRMTWSKTMFWDSSFVNFSVYQILIFPNIYWMKKKYLKFLVGQNTFYKTKQKIKQHYHDYSNDLQTLKVTAMRRKYCFWKT